MKNDVCVYFLVSIRLARLNDCLNSDLCMDLLVRTFVVFNGGFRLMHVIAKIYRRRSQVKIHAVCIISFLPFNWLINSSAKIPFNEMPNYGCLASKTSLCRRDLN